MTYADEAARIVARYGLEAWRYLGWGSSGLALIDGWKDRAVAVGMTRDQAEEVWASVERDQMLAPAPFDAIREADRRLAEWRSA